MMYKINMRTVYLPPIVCFDFIVPAILRFYLFAIISYNWPSPAGNNSKWFIIITIFFTNDSTRVM